jgi:hypothetical protein
MVSRKSLPDIMHPSSFEACMWRKSRTSSAKQCIDQPHDASFSPTSQLHYPLNATLAACPDMSSVKCTQLHHQYVALGDDEQFRGLEHTSVSMRPVSQHHPSTALHLVETSRELVPPIVMRTFYKTLRRGSGVLSHLGQAASCIARAMH